MFDVKIMAVRSRAESVERLRTLIPSAEAVYDDRGDNGGGDAWYNARRCWLSEPSVPATHRLVLQDDVILCKSFLQYADKCMRFKPEAVWSFYVGWRAEQKFPEYKDTPYLRIRGCKTGAPALLIPFDYCREIISETDIIFGADYPHDDSRIGWWCAYHGIPLMTTNPQIVQHSPIKSVLNHNAKRFSRTFCSDPSDLNWDAKHCVETKLITPWLWTDKPKAVGYANEAKAREKRRLS